MYSLDINFVKDPILGYTIPNQPRTGPGFKLDDKAALMAGIAIAVVPVAAVMGAWWFIKGSNGGLQTEKAQIEQQILALQPKVAEVQKAEGEIAQLEIQSKFFASIFDTSVKPMSSLIQEIGTLLPPGVQLSKIKHNLAKAEGENIQPDSPWGVVQQEMEITGLAPSFDKVGDFMVMLKQSPFFNGTETDLIEAKLVEIPIQMEWKGEGTQPPDLKKPEVVEYTIKARVSNLPASKILADLERTGDKGLVTRINELKELGVISDGVQ